MNRDELSSTEKLLEHIRGKPPSSDSPRLVQDSEATRSSGWGERFRSAVGIKKTICVGVDLGYADLRMIKTVPSGTHRHQIIDYRRVPFDPGLEPRSLLFPQFLRRSLKSFLGPVEQHRIWTTISSARLDVRLLRIPKVARRRIPNAVIWAYKNKIPYSDKEQLFDFEIIGEITENDSPQIEVLAYTIPRDDIDAVKSTFLRAGHPLEGVSTYPFLLQNLLRTRWKIFGQGHLCALYIGRTWSRIDIFQDGNLLLSRGIRAGLNSMLDAIKADPRLNVAPPLSPSPASDFQPSLPPDVEPEPDIQIPLKVLACLAPETAQSLAQDAVAREEAGPLEPEDVFAMIMPALDRLIRQIERTIGHFAINIEDHDIDRLCISGMMCESTLVCDYISDQLGIAQVDLNPFANEPLEDQPVTRQEQAAYIPAVGLASPPEKKRPNFLQTYHDRARRETRQRFNCAVFAVFLLTMAGLLGYNGWQQRALQMRQDRLTALEQELASTTPLLKPETVLVLAAKAKEAATRLVRYGERYTGLAVIAEISQRTPVAIRMTRMAMRLSPKINGADDPPRRTLSISGIVRGERLNLESTLAAYMVQLKLSPLLADPKITEKTFEMLDGREVLRFSAELEIL